MNAKHPQGENQGWFSLMVAAKRRVRVVQFVMILLLNLLFCQSTYAINNNQLLQDRIVSISQQFLNRPYQFEPLGEGASGEFNQEPLYRVDRFDCETYIDTVLALALSSNQAQFQEILLQLRYRNGSPDFIMRNHFPESDWLPNNIQKGFIKNITTQIASPAQLDSATVFIDRKDWYKNLGANRINIPGLTPTQLQQKIDLLHGLATKVTNQEVTLTYIKATSLVEVAEKIPNDAIILIIHPKPNGAAKTLGTQILISHMGFAVWEGNSLNFRAASSLYGEVVDIPLLSYLHHHPRIDGIIVLLPA